MRLRAASGLMRSITGSEGLPAPQSSRFSCGRNIIHTRRRIVSDRLPTRFKPVQKRAELPKAGFVETVNLSRYLLLDVSRSHVYTPFLHDGYIIALLRLKVNNNLSFKFTIRFIGLNC